MAERLCADAFVTGLRKVEAHLSRELERVLNLLARRRAERFPAPVAVRAVGLVLGNGVVQGAATPPPGDPD